MTRRPPLHFRNSVQQNLSPGWMIPVPNFYPSNLLNILLGSLNGWPRDFLAHRELVLRPHGLGLWILARSIHKKTHQKRKHKAGRNQKKKASSKGPQLLYWTQELFRRKGAIPHSKLNASRFFNFCQLLGNLMDPSHNLRCFRTTKRPVVSKDAKGQLLRRKLSYGAQLGHGLQEMTVDNQNNNDNNLELFRIRISSVFDIDRYHYDYFIMIITFINYYMVWVFLLLNSYNPHCHWNYKLPITVE